MLLLHIRARSGTVRAVISSYVPTSKVLLVIHGVTQQQNRLSVKVTPFLHENSLARKASNSKETQKKLPIVKE